MNKIEKQALIKKENINKYHYTTSLLQEAYLNGLINNHSLILIQTEIMMIMKKLILQYTKGESTSVRVETAERIQYSIMYALDVYLKSYNDPIESLNQIKTRKMEELYEKGINKIEQLFNKCKRLYKKVKKHKLPMPLKVYNSTIDQALPMFFAHYDIIYNAQNTMTMIDYPLVFDDMNVEGVVYIKNYLETLKLETVFMNYFKNTDIKHTLENFGRQYTIDYKETPLNMFEIILNNAIFVAILRNDVTNITISTSEYSILKDMLINNTKLTSIINQATKKVIRTLNITDEQLRLYIQTYKHRLLPRIENAIKNDSLSNLIIADGCKKELEPIAFSSKESLCINDFRKVLTEINNCNVSTDKIDVILAKIKSLDDLIDVLSSDCLYGSEYNELYARLGEIEIAVLVKMVFYEEFRDTNLDFQSLEIKDDYNDWEKHLNEFLLELDFHHKKRLIHLVERYEFAES